MIRLVKGYFVVGGQIHEAEFRINWDKETAFAINIADGSKWQGREYPKEQWSITIDKAMLLAQNQAKAEWKRIENIDPLVASTWKDFYKDLCYGNYIVYRF